MAQPNALEIEIALLQAIVAGGGGMRPRDAYPAVAALFPEMTPEDLKQTVAKGGNRWQIRVRFVRKHLVGKGEIEPHPRGIWRITDRGRQRVEPQPHEEKIHKRIQTEIAEIGALLGYYTSTEHKLDPYRYDVIWKRDQWQPSPGNVFEIQHHGSLEAALLKLKHAHDVCKPKLCLVVTGEQDQKKVEQLLGPLFAGVFHEIRSETTVLTAQQVVELRNSLTGHENVLKRLVGK